MLVYAVRLWIHPQDQIELFEGISKWLSNWTERTVPVSYLTQDTSRQYPHKEQAKLQTTYVETDEEMLASIVLTHADRSIRGRKWNVEVGVRKRRHKDFVCSVVVKTDDMSALVGESPTPSQPGLVRIIRERCTLIDPTAGRSVGRLLNPMDAVAFDYTIRDPERRRPIVLLSKNDNGRYAVDPGQLDKRLIGLADLVLVEPPDENTMRQISAELGRYATWGGAVSIIYPSSKAHPKPSVRKLLPEELEHNTMGVAPHVFLFSLVTHVTNVPATWQHVTQEQVILARRTHELQEERNRAVESGQLADYTRLLETENDETRQQLTFMKSRVEDLEEKNLQLEIDNEESNSTHRYELQSLKERLRELEESRKDGDLPPSVLVDAVLAYHKEPTLLSALELVSALFPDRIYLLPEAFKSARKSVIFKYPEVALNKLLRLASDYYPIIISGKGDAEARKVFGKDEYSAKESETVENKRAAVEARTFSYDGKTVVMWKHLKHGVKDSLAETLRIHFEWDADLGRLVIGHCGYHLTHKS